MTAGIAGRQNRRGYATFGSDGSAGPLAQSLHQAMARAKRVTDGEVEGEVLDLPPRTSENEEKCSGGETRTHNLAGAHDEDPEQHRLE